MKYKPLFSYPTINCPKPGIKNENNAAMGGSTNILNLNS